MYNTIFSAYCDSPHSSLHVTPYSKLVFRVYDHSTFKKDALLGDCRYD